jgi:hypothetical protein
MPYDNIVVDNDDTIRTAVWHAGDPPIVAPGWDTTNESGTWTFTNADFTGEAV